MPPPHPLYLTPHQLSDLPCKLSLSRSAFPKFPVCLLNLPALLPTCPCGPLRPCLPYPQASLNAPRVLMPKGPLARPA